MQKRLLGNLSSQFTHKNDNYFTMLHISWILMKRFPANIDAWKKSDRWRTTQICGRQADQAEERGKQEHHVHCVVFNHKCDFSKGCQGFSLLSIGHMPTMHSRCWVPCICKIANGGLRPTTRTLLVWTVHFFSCGRTEPNPNQKLEQNCSFRPTETKPKSKSNILHSTRTGTQL